MEERVAYVEVTTRISRGCPVLCRAHFNPTRLQEYTGIGVCVWQGMCGRPQPDQGNVWQTTAWPGIFVNTVLSSEIKGWVLPSRFMTWMMLVFICFSRLLAFLLIAKASFSLRRYKQVFFPLPHWRQQLLQPPEVEALPLTRWTMDVPQVVSRNSGSCGPVTWVFLLPCESGRHSKQQQVSGVRQSFTSPPRGVHNLLPCKSLLQVSIHRARWS